MDERVVEIPNGNGIIKLIVPADKPTNEEWEELHKRIANALDVSKEKG